MTDPLLFSTPSPLEIMILRGTRYNNRFINNLLYYLPPNDIIALSKASRLLRGVVGCYSDIAWNLERTLGRWFSNVDTVRCKMDECRAVIGGEVAMGFFDRRRKRGTELQIFLPLGGLLRMGEYLLGSGYETTRRIPAVNFLSAAFAVSMHARASAFSVVPTLCDPPLAEFSFTRRSPKARVVVIYVVRPDPIYFVLSLPNSECLNLYPDCF